MLIGTSEIWVSKHDIAKGQTGALWDRHLDSSQFFRLLFRLKALRGVTFKYLPDSNTEYIDAAVEEFIF